MISIHIQRHNMSEKWIQKATKNKGALHKKLGVRKGNKIPSAMLKEKEHAKGKLGKEVRLAETLKKLKK
jgi:hypothetical protein